MESRIIRIIISVILIGSMLITNPVSIFAADMVEDFEGWGFIDGTPALSGGVYTYNNWKFIAKIDGAAANDGAIEKWTGPAGLSISTGYGQVDELHVLNSNGDEFNFGGFNFTGSSIHRMFVTGWRDGIQVTEKQFINYSDTTADEYFDMRSKDSEFKNVDEIRICGADLGGGNLDIISGYLESLTYDVTPVDEVPPIILGLTMTSDNANVTTVAKVGDQITLSITTNENIQSPTVTIAGQTAIVSDAGDGDAKIWKATYIMQESDTEGTIPFTLNFKDIVNNEAMQVTAVTAGSPVIFDKTAPTAPTAVTVTPIGGTVIANSLNKSNTNMTATATITAADVTGGKAELYLSDTPIASDTSITSGDTQVTFNLGTNNNAELQAAVALGGIVSVKLYDMAGNTSISSISNPTLTVDYISEIPAPPTAIVQPITGTLEVGETLTGHYTYSDVNGDLEGTSIYKWYSSDNMAGLNKTVIAGAITKTYVLTSTDIGKYISFEVTPVAATGIAQGIAVESARTGPVVLAEAVPTATVKAITGILQVGETLTGNYTYSDVNGDLEGASTYKWYRADNSAGFNKTEIAGANAKTYVLTSSDEGKYIGFEVTPVALTGIEQGTAVLSAWTGAVVPAETAPTVTVQAITGTLQVGKTLTGYYTYSDVNGDLEGTSTYKWYRADSSSGLNKTEIAGANAKTYVLQSVDEGKYISFEVTPVALTGIAQGTAVLSAWAGIIVPAEAPPTATVQAITGTLQVGESLTGNYTYSDVNGDLEGASTYKWYRADNMAGLNKIVIAGATTKTYVLTSGDIGKYISFEVTPVAVTGIAQGITVESAWVGPVVVAQVAPTAIVQQITGTLQVGETLTGYYTYNDVNGDEQGASTYKWYRADNASGLNKTAIAGATGIIYVLTSADGGKYISFEVTPVATTGIAQGIAVESTWAGPVVVAQVAPIAIVQQITGTLQVGETLIGHYTYSDVNGDLEGTSIYKWYRADNSLGLNKVEIVGATTKTYMLTSADEGKYISFEVTPVAATGIAQGTAVESVRTGVVGKKSGQSGGGSNSPKPVITPTIDILINNHKVNYATSEIEVENGRKKTTIQLDDEKLTAKLNTENVGSTIIIPVYNNSDIVIGQLNGQTVKSMQDKDATLEIKTENVTYTIPAAAINIGSISERIGSQVQLKDIKVNISVSNSSKETITKVETSAKMNNFQLVVHPTDFEITCTNGSKTVEVSQFNHYVERTVLLPKGVDPNQITTGVVFNKDGTFTHVPTIVKYVDERYYAKINSLTNSTYTVIWNPVTFKDVEKHWAKDYVNDVGSRLIDDGVGNGNFAPNRAITRAEFASMIVKALGLKGTNSSEKFGDVHKEDSYYDYIYTAYEYGILNGYSNGNFGPQDLITREQAMTMLAKAMKIAGMNVTVSDTDVSNQLKLFKDAESISLYARQSAIICIENGIFTGDNKGRLTPQDNLTRAESATIIIKLLKKAELI